MCISIGSLLRLNGKGEEPSPKQRESKRCHKDRGLKNECFWGTEHGERWVRKGWDSTSRRTVRMEKLKDEKCLCNEVWFSASASRSRHGLSSGSSSQGFFSIYNFLYSIPNSCGYLWSQSHCFSVMQWKRVTRRGLRLPQTKACLSLSLPLTTLALFSLCYLTLSGISVASKKHGVLMCKNLLLNIWLQSKIIAAGNS